MIRGGRACTSTRRRTISASGRLQLHGRRRSSYEEDQTLRQGRLAGLPSLRNVEVDKGTAEKPEVRCRLVARDFRVKGERHRDDLFVAMPPEAKTLLFKMAAATWKGRSKGKERDKIMLIDVKKAHLNGVVGADVWACIELPEEDYEEGKCGRLRRWLYGMRPAAKAWEDDYAEKLESIGFLRGKAAPTVFHHLGWKVRIVVHGDRQAAALGHGQDGAAGVVHHHGQRGDGPGCRGL